MAKSPRQLPADDAPVMGIGSCLAGNAVRYDGRTRRSHTNVLSHLAGYLKKPVPAAERQRLKDLIEQYRHGQVPLIVPMTILKLRSLI
jgi:hypothetical protein